jgi:uncharacterized membrane protein YoaK (UPF0700 family)
MVISSRHAPSWLLLAMGAGAVNAGALLACERFVSHVTGTVTQVGVNFERFWLMLDYFLVLLSFVAGAMASVLAIGARVQRGKQPLHILALVMVAVALILIALAGHLGAFGQFGASPDQPGDFLMLSLLGFAMGLQNATVATSTGLAIRTTHMTGPATDFGIHLASSLFARGEERRTALKHAFLRGGKIFAFILGGVLMVPVVRAVGYLAFALPALLVLTAAARSFVPAWLRHLAPRLALPSSQ